MTNNLANAYTFGSLLRENSKADAAYGSIMPQQKQDLLLKVASASPEELPKIVSELENSAR